MQIASISLSGDAQAAAAEPISSRRPESETGPEPAQSAERRLTLNDALARLEDWWQGDERIAV